MTAGKMATRGTFYETRVKRVVEKARRGMAAGGAAGMLLHNIYYNNSIENEK